MASDDLPAGELPTRSRTPRPPGGPNDQSADGWLGVADAQAGEWREHPRFAGVLLKNLLTSADNALASVNVVRVPRGREIGRHIHAAQVETIYVLAGQGLFRLGAAEVPVRTGHVVAVPMGVEHGLHNPGAEPVELLTIFTPPLSYERNGRSAT